MLKNLSILTKSYGVPRGFFIYCNLKFNSSGTLKLPKLLQPIYFRPKTIDEFTIIEIFGLNCYDIELPFEPKLIIDAGANIGYASIYLAQRHRNAKIIAIEPESENFNLLLSNIVAYKNIEAINNALWQTSSYVSIKDKGFGTRGFVVEESTKEIEGSFKAISINDLIKESDLIDILKIDIEGSEKYLFEKNYENWLPRVKCLIIELHDFMNEGCSDAVYSAMNKYNFSSYKKGENIIFFNKDLT